MANTIEKKLVDAAALGDLESVKNAINQKANLNFIEEFGSSALHKAAGNGHLETVKYLVEKGADLELKDSVDMPPLMSAATAGQVKVVEYLIEVGAKISHDLLSSVQMKVNILEENAESGMVRPEAAEAWRRFLEYLVSVYQEQNP